jgi:hypothetical protein
MANFNCSALTDGATLNATTLTGTTTSTGTISSTAIGTGFVSVANSGLQYSGSGSNTPGVGVMMFSTNVAGNTGVAFRRTTSNYLAFDFYIAGWAQKAQLDQNGNLTIAGTYSPSDKRLKADVRSLSSESGLPLISKLRPVSYRWADPSRGAGVQVGFLAQEMRTAFPLAVGNSGIVTSETPDGMLTLDYSRLVTPIVLAVQQLDLRTRTLQERQSQTLALKAANDNLAAEIVRLEAQIVVLQRKVGIQTAQR